MLLKERLRALPKAELHVHLDGSLRPSTMLELAAPLGVSLPASEPEALASAMRAGNSRDLVEYLEKFAITLSLMQTPDALERTAFELAEDSAAENVRYLEVRYGPVLHTAEGLSMAAVNNAVLDGLARAEAETGIRTGVIVCGLRDRYASASMQQAELAVEFRHQGVIGFDLAGAEAGFPAKGGYV